MTFTPSAPMHVGFELNTELRFIPTNEGKQSLSIVTTIFLTVTNDSDNELTASQAF
jgi:hypothetical protein